jgi:haloalkane dehalogenase
MTKRTISIIFLFGILFFFSCRTEIKQEQETAKSKIQFNEKSHYNFLKVEDSLKMAYLDLGNVSDPLVVLLHGEPNSSFVYRDIAPSIVEQGFRVIIPDLIGFGFSDKPVNPEEITYSNQTKWLGNFLERLDLIDINLYAHDWGGMISLRIIAEKPEKFKNVAVSYAYLFEGTEEIPEGFLGFKEYAKTDSNFSAGDIMNWGSYKKLSDSLKSKYDEPFKNTDFVAARRFPWLIPVSPEDKEAVLNKKLNKNLAYFEKPFITIWGDHKDPMWIGKDSILQKHISGAKNQIHYTLESNHFIQEDKPEELTQILIDFFKSNNTEASL